MNETDSAASSSSSTIGAAASTAADGAVYTGFAGSGSGSNSGGSNSDKSGDTISGAAALLDVGRLYGLGVVLAGVFAGFSLLL